MKMNSVLKLVTLVVAFNSVNARSLDFEEARVEEARRMGVLPITPECRDTIRDVFFEGKDSVKLLDWTRIFLEQTLRASKATKLHKWVLQAAEMSFRQIDLNKNGLIELDEFEKKYLDKIKGYRFTPGNEIKRRALFITDGWSKERINKNTHNCKFFNPMRTYSFERYVSIL